MMAGRHQPGPPPQHHSGPDEGWSPLLPSSGKQRTLVSCAQEPQPLEPHLLDFKVLIKEHVLLELNFGGMPPPPVSVLCVSE